MVSIIISYYWALAVSTYKRNSPQGGMEEISSRVYCSLQSPAPGAPSETHPWVSRGDASNVYPTSVNLSSWLAYGSCNTVTFRNDTDLRSRHPRTGYGVNSHSPDTHANTSHKFWNQETRVPESVFLFSTTTWLCQVPWSSMWISRLLPRMRAWADPLLCIPCTALSTEVPLHLLRVSWISSNINF